MSPSFLSTPALPSSVVLNLAMLRPDVPANPSRTSPLLVVPSTTCLIYSCGMAVRWTVDMTLSPDVIEKIVALKGVVSASVTDGARDAEAYTKLRDELSESPD